ncbi:hypothetical protein KR032_012252 [Drosophila birchii]|nr:hypothetical protein KR032_012252 [Drosophila birchii]
MAKTKGDKSGKLAKKKANKIKVEPSTSSQADKAPKGATGTGNNNTEENGIWRDARFQHLMADPRFRGVPKVQRKVKIDKRFQGMFTDDKFKVKYTIDKYGRPVNKSNSEDLRKFYELDENDSDSDEEEEQKGKQDQEEATEEQQERRAEELAIADLQAKDSDDDSESELPQSLRERLTNPDVDYARGEGRLMTDSSSDEDSGDEEGPELQIDHVWGELDNDAESTEESTRRLAVCNMDWDRIRAEDLMVMLSSFLPPGGSILSVKIYPSEFGKARMAEEEVHGPKELVERREEEHSDDSDEELVREQDSDAEEGDDYHMEKLRKYQLNRLRYYYAVVECDTVATADKVYQECDGIEYESSATRVDLRFIPDDTSFEEDTPTDECHELPDASSYKPRQFTTTALQQAKVDLTWDETALDRRELGDKLSTGQVDKLTDKELRQIVAYSSEEESEEEEEEQKEQDQDQEKEKPQQVEKLAKPSKQERIAKYKNLLAEMMEKEKQEKEQKYEMEMSWNVDDTPQLEQKEQQLQQQQPPAQLTPIEKVLQKRSEKNKMRKEQRRQKQLEAKGGGEPGNDGNDSDASLVPDGIDLNDAYFAEEFANGDYAPPKTKQQKKKTKSRAKGKTNGEEDAAHQQQERELELLLDDGDGRDERQHFSLSKILKQEELEQSASGSKRKRRQQLKKSKGKGQLESSEKPDDDFQLNVEDARFKAVYKSHEFNIDPTHSHYKATKGMQRIISEKLKRRQEQPVEAGGEDDEPAAAPKRSKQQLERNALVKSIKLKLQQQEKRGKKL